MPRYTITVTRTLVQQISQNGIIRIEADNPEEARRLALRIAFEPDAAEDVDAVWDDASQEEEVEDADVDEVEEVEDDDLEPE